VAVLLATSYLYISLGALLLSEEQSALLDRLQAAVSLVQASPNDLSAARERIAGEWPTRSFEQIVVRVAKLDGTPVVETPDLPHEIVNEVFPLSSEIATSHIKIAPTRLMVESGKSYLSVHATLDTYRVFAATDLSKEDELLASYRLRSILLLGVALLLSAVLGRRLAKAAFEPVNGMSDAAKRIRMTTLHERIEEKELPSELRSLSTTINQMLQRLEDSFSRLSRFSADIAHELRTPINNIMGEVGVALTKERPNEEYREILASCLEETTRITKIIDSLLFIAKAEDPKMEILKERIHLKTEITNLSDFFDAAASESGVSITVSVPENLEVQAEKTLFQTALGNVISNAINYTPTGGTVKVNATQNGPKIEILVQDSGEGISEEHLNNLFDRFYRADPARKATKFGGVGLGLTIVRSILTLHHGDIQIESVLGKGTQVRLRFPATIS
jgi:two-component system heavy metal sensor histidine kinase CusS